MKNYLLLWIRIVAIAIIILGCIHLAATSLVYKMMFDLDSSRKLVFLFMYLAAGFGTILPGIIVAQLRNELVKLNRKAWIVCRICTIYLIIFGIAAVVTMMDNPFAYMGLLLGILLFLPLQKIRVYFNTK